MMDSSSPVSNSQIVHSCESLSTLSTEYCADSAEFCPDHPRYLAIGTYQLLPVQEAESTEAKKASLSDDGLAEAEEQEQEQEQEQEGGGPKMTRAGRCLLYEVCEGGRRIHEVQRFDLPAILDMKWSPSILPSQMSKTLAIADAKGKITLHDWDEESHTLGMVSRLKQTHCVEVAGVGEDGKDRLSLSLDWSVETTPKIATSISDGTVSILQLSSRSSQGWEEVSRWHAHDFEPWIAAWDRWESGGGEVIWSGGDDCKLKGWDLRMGTDTPTFVNKRFDGGVTSIQSHPHLENIFAVGSYDSQVRIFDKRKTSSPATTLDVGGGVWRVKWHPDSKKWDQLLLACMHNGFSVVRMASEDGQGLELTKRFEGHESLAYGVDWQRGGGNGNDGEDTTLVASASFYDHVLHLWKA